MSLFDADILMDVARLPEPWMKAVTVSHSVLETYMQPDLMPKVGGEMNFPVSKKSRRDVLAYRIRSPQDIAGCIMASYGSSHTLPMRTLQAFGLYGTLVLSEATVRFFRPQS